MSKLVGVGAVSERDNKEIAILKSQIEALKEEKNLLAIEKEDLEKVAKELKEKIDELENTTKREKTSKKDK